MGARSAVRLALLLAALLATAAAVSLIEGASEPLPGGGRASARVGLSTMATSTTVSDRRAETLAFIRASQARMTEHRAAVLRSVDTLRRVAEKRRGRRA